MKPCPLRSLLIVTFAFACLLSPARALPPQPRMAKAIEELEAAKTAVNPLPHLEAARKALKNSRPNKEGQRLDAIGFVNEAIAYARSHARGDMLDRINKAIGNAKSGMARSGPR